MNTSILEQVMDVGLSFAGPLTKRKVTDHIQIHHTVGYYGSPERWRILHKRKIEQNDHLGVGYSYLVTQSGDIYLGRGHEYAHGGVRDDITNKANQRSVAIALDGDMRKAGLPSDAQTASAIKLTQELMALYQLPADKVLGHNEVSLYSNGKPTGKTYRTLCPCIDMAAFRAQLVSHSNSVEPEILLGAGATTPQFPAQYCYTGSTFSNIRSAPNRNALTVGRISSGETCMVYDATTCTQFVWLLIDTGSMRGWCNANYLSEVQA